METNETINLSDTFFVIDIGTRFVRGLLCMKKKEAPGAPQDALTVHILDCEVLEHESRAMLSGQIHDIEKVTHIVRRLKEGLEKKLSLRGTVRDDLRDQGPEQHGQPITLKKIAIAVAGRNLVTYRGNAEITRPLIQPVTPEDMKQIELAAVQHALEQVNTEVEYYCVGYSPSGYWLDGEELSTLIDHRGSVIRAEVLVTLLPRQVLEALFAVMKKVDLEIEYLTLEPIAALESTLSQNLRSLDLVLVDIGAGTSDIAIVSKGKIKAYGMVPAAGDMITETVSSEFLVDFNEAERIKRETGIISEPMPVELHMPDGSIGFSSQDAGGRIVFRDIFDREHDSPKNEILAKVRPAVRNLTRRIVEEVRALVPDMARPDAKQYAVVLVGGGSLTPYLEEELSEALQLPRQRIGIRPAILNRSLDDATGRFHGPDAATATGIALLRARQAGLSLTHVTINDRRVTAVSSERNPNVLSVLLSNGITVKQIYGRPGMAKTYTLNGKLCSMKGDPPGVALVELNGQKVALDTPVKEGDKIVFYPATDGKDAQRQIKDILQLPVIRFNGQETVLPATIMVNGVEAKPDAVIDDRADIQYAVITDLHGILAHNSVDTAIAGEREICANVNGEDLSLKSKQYSLTINHKEADINQPVEIREHDDIEFSALQPHWKISDVVSQPVPGKDLRVKINGEEYLFPGGKGKILRNGADAMIDDQLHHGDIIRTVSGKDAEAVLVDIFRHISVAPQDQVGKRMKLLIDGQESQFTSPLHDNAEVRVLFE